MPSFTSGWPNLACSLAMRRWQAIASPHPPPSARPVAAATPGLHHPPRRPPPAARPRRHVLPPTPHSPRSLERMPVQAIAWTPSGAVRIVDQRALPEAHIERDLESVAAMAEAIRTLQVRGAPLIGIAAAMGLVAGLRDERGTPRERFLARVEELAAPLAAARPTAVNLRWALDRMRRAGALMRQAEVDLALVGADRIAANGDFANKIGTYALAVLALHHGVPFYCAAPSTTIDATLADGDGIPIEQRPVEEVKTLAGRPIAPAAAGALNPAFDVTPARYVTGYLMERGMVKPPFGADP